MKFDYADTFEASRGTGYEVLLYGALNGDPTLFSRTDFVEDSWRIFQPVLDHWRDTRGDFPNYMAGSWGPREAGGLLARDGRRWHEFVNREVLLRSEFFAAAPPVLLNTLALDFQPLAAAAGHGWHTFERSSDLVWRMLDESPKSRIELPAAAAVAADGQNPDAHAVFASVRLSQQRPLEASVMLKRASALLEALCRDMEEDMLKEDDGDTGDTDDDDDDDDEYEVSDNNLDDDDDEE
jgi:hypothetical protein